MRIGVECGIQEVNGVDLSPGKGVDFTVDFSTPTEDFGQRWGFGSFATVAIFNVLEHTFDPENVLRNAVHCMTDGGSIIVVTPTVWPLHDFPQDCVRLMPHWYEMFASRYRLTLHRDAFCWLSQFGITRVDDLLDGGQYQFPSLPESGASVLPRTLLGFTICTSGLQYLRTIPQFYPCGHRCGLHQAPGGSIGLAVRSTRKHLSGDV